MMEDLMAEVGVLNFDACQMCKHYDKEVGGCKPHHQHGTMMYTLDVENKKVTCDCYEYDKE